MAQDDGTHPEIRNIRAANYATHRYRRRGIPGPEPDAVLAIREVEESLQRRGLLAERQISNRIRTSASSTARLIATTSTRLPPAQTGFTTRPVSSSRLPVPTPKTKDSLGVGQDGDDLGEFFSCSFPLISKAHR